MSGDARVLTANRSQLSWDLVDLEALLAMDHRARLVWRFVETLELGPFYEAIKSREGEAGRPAADPKVLPALWLYATLEGVGSARELDRLVGRDIAYRWLAGVYRSTTTGFRTFGLGKLRSWTGC
jgi:transposase